MPDALRILWVAATPVEAACAPTHSAWRSIATGCGPAAAACGLGFHLGREATPDLVIGIGIAGAYADSGIPVGRVVAVESDNFCDLGCEDGEAFLDLLELGIPQVGVEPAYTCAFPAFLSGLPKVVATTCSVCTGSLSTAKARRERTGAALESMEGAAWAMSCLRAGVPFAQVRAVSNIAGPRDRSAWRIPQALAALRQALEEACAKI
ncbi:MAG: Futalosine hydrolase [Fibrobacterota bacterium]|jgi:futalosine hydrolase